MRKHSRLSSAAVVIAALRVKASRCLTSAINHILIKILSKIIKEKVKTYFKVINFCCTNFQMHSKVYNELYDMPSASKGSGRRVIMPLAIIRTAV